MNLSNAGLYGSSKFSETFGTHFTEEGIDQIEEYAAEYGEDEVIAAIDIACEKYESAIEAWLRISGILYNRRRIRTKYLEDDAE